MDNLYIIMPAYNEEANIRTVIAEWYPVIEKIGNNSKLVIIDDGSKDNTHEIMLEEAKTKPNFIPITKKNSGHGGTVLYGYQYAVNAGADYVFQTDSDGQTVAKEFWKFWKKRHDYDMLIGNRKDREDGFSRILVTKTLKLVIMICFHVNITDANTPYRLMEGTVLKENLKFIPEKYHLSNVLLSVIYAKKQLSVRYLPITFRPRQGGTNSINIKSIIKIGQKALKDFVTINRNLR